jgi:uncharacterized protein (TIGR04255 family)
MNLNYRLRRERHAITEFVATVQLFQPVGQVVFTNVVSGLKTLAQQLNLPAPTPIIQFGFGQLVGAQMLPTGGVGFQRFAADGEIAESLVCDGNSINYTLREYSSWIEVKPKILDVFATLLEIYAEEVPALSSLRLQYLNEFSADSGTTRSASELFKPNKWVPSFALEMEDAWHSHIGAFLPAEGDLRYLINVNCDISNAQQPAVDLNTWVAKILVLSGCYYNIVGASPLVFEPGNIARDLDGVLEDSHNLEKFTLRQIIADPYLKAMGAFDGD